jgi:Predicted sugar kinase
MYEKVVIVTRKTRLDELIERFNTRAQAKFYVERAGGDYEDYEKEHAAYGTALDIVKKQLRFDLKTQIIDRSLVPTFLFSNKDLIVAVGQDGLVANTAKYTGDQPIIGVNPDPARFDGILTQTSPGKTCESVDKVLKGTATIQNVTLAEAVLNDRQRLLAFNDLFIGARTHVSARYSIEYKKKVELQSSSGILVSTGAGSTGWLSSVFNMVAGVTASAGNGATHLEMNHFKWNWDESKIAFVVREPFISKHSSAGTVFGLIESGEEILIESLMPAGGVIFSDGVESDFLAFNSGAIAHIRASTQKSHIVMPA